MMQLHSTVASNAQDKRCSMSFSVGEETSACSADHDQIELALKEKELGAYGTTTFSSDTELTVRAQNTRSKNARSYRAI